MSEQYKVHPNISDEFESKVSEFENNILCIMYSLIDCKSRGRGRGLKPLSQGLKLLRINSVFSWFSIPCTHLSNQLATHFLRRSLPQASVSLPLSSVLLSHRSPSLLKLPPSAVSSASHCRVSHPSQQCPLFFQHCIPPPMQTFLNLQLSVQY